MAETLASIIDRCEVFLADKNNKSWTTETLTECIRFSLAEINKVAGATYTIDDLDLAAATTLPGEDLPALIMGVAAFAAKNRAVDRMEKPGLGEGPEKGLNDWGSWAQSNFKNFLIQIKRKAINESTDAPHSAMTWEEDPHDW
jgi:hypothetical protein